MQYFEEQEGMVEKLFKVCGITNALDGSENSLIRCTKELPNQQVPYVNEAEEDPFQAETVKQMRQLIVMKITMVTIFN